MKKRFALSVLALFAGQAAFAEEPAQQPEPQAVEASPEKDVISFFSAMCLQTGGKVAEIEAKLGKAQTQIDKKTTTTNYTKEESEDVWTVPSAGSEPYIVSVTKGGTCYVGFNSMSPEKMRQEFKSFVLAQATAIKTTPEIMVPDEIIPDEVEMDFYSIKLPGTENKIKFSISLPNQPIHGYRSTMTVATE